MAKYDPTEVMRELARRAKRKTLLDSAFAEQRAFIDDPARFKAALTTRRAGKSTGSTLALVQTCLDKPNTDCLFLGLTRASAKKAIWNRTLPRLNADYGLGIDLNHAELTAKFPNGSCLYLSGADATKDESDKILGQHYKMIVIDEAGSFRTDLQNLIEETLRATLIDQRGSLCLIGTPKNHRNYFYNVTSGQVPGWKTYHWSGADNPHIPWAEEIAEMIRDNPRIEETPLFQQDYLGRWVVDDSKLVYAFNEGRNLIEELPESDSWTYVLGVDLGYRDATALVLGGYRPNDPTLYVIRAEGRTELTFSDVATWIKSWQSQYNIVTTVVDGANRQGVEEMRQRGELNLEITDKRGLKVDSIYLMNSDFITERVKILESGCHDLLEELPLLVWDERSAKKQEHPACSNHCADAMLYTWRASLNYYNKPLEPKKRLSDEEKMNAYWDKRDADIERSRREDPLGNW